MRIEYEQVPGINEISFLSFSRRLVVSHVLQA